MNDVLSQLFTFFGVVAIALALGTIAFIIGSTIGSIHRIRVDVKNIKDMIEQMVGDKK